MRFYKIVLLSVIAIFGAQSLVAQIGGSQRSQQRGYGVGQGSNISYEAEKPDAGERAQENANLYAEELGIDAFKKEVLKNYLKDYYIQKFDVTYSTTLESIEKRKLLDAAKVKFEKQMAPVFSEENVSQILAFEDIGAEKIKKEKKKRKKKNKKKRKG
ncbi:hypothetical protein EAX61_00840 [Dokdonia sinensis]|uniref:DUF4890 domain-containing protein n=1 Tax=Dokdonia sinensis TaxID=2479847 RepID=A0A3M0GH16_9FLAO|nr:hypothetical protein [Dokdonia sinensis]RMB63960.1 hypothetical protein EAX61_00840 [Dokdonia sinensis]